MCGIFYWAKKKMTFREQILFSWNNERDLSKPLESIKPLSILWRIRIWLTYEIQFQFDDCLFICFLFYTFRASFLSLETLITQWEFRVFLLTKQICFNWILLRQSIYNSRLVMQICRLYYITKNFSVNSVDES